MQGPTSSGAPIVASEYAGESQPGSEYAAAVAEYHSSRARYIRTVTSGVEKRLMETIGKRRMPLMDELANLTVLAHDRYETYQGTLRAYSAKAPGRVTAAGLQPPTPKDRMFAGVDKLYKAAVKAADEFREVNDIIKKRKEKLSQIDWKMREQVEQVGRDLIAQLETESGLEGAFKRDPLLARAHARMLGAKARETSAVTVLETPGAAATS
jgi:hypothetical protein